MVQHEDPELARAVRRGSSTSVKSSDPSNMWDLKSGGQPRPRCRVSRNSGRRNASSPTWTRPEKGKANQPSPAALLGLGHEHERPRRSSPNSVMPAASHRPTTRSVTPASTSPSTSPTRSARPATSRTRGPRYCAGRCSRRHSRPLAPARPWSAPSARERDHDSRRSTSESFGAPTTSSASSARRRSPRSSSCGRAGGQAEPRRHGRRVRTLRAPG